MMEIRIHRAGREDVNGDDTDIVNSYVVTEEGREFTITCRTRLYGTRLGLAGEEGFLYTSDEDNTVWRQVVALGGACGLNIEEELVEGLSPCAIRGVVLAERMSEAQEIIIALAAEGGGRDKPAVIVDGRAVDIEGW